MKARLPTLLAMVFVLFSCEVAVAQGGLEGLASGLRLLGQSLTNVAIAIGALGFVLGIISIILLAFFTVLAWRGFVTEFVGELKMLLAGLSLFATLIIVLKTIGTYVPELAFVGTITDRIISTALNWFGVGGG